MALILEKGGVKKPCFVCGASMSRLISPKAVKDTRLAFQLVDVIDSDPRHPDVRSLGDSMGLRAWGCDNMECGHVEFYGFVASPEIMP